MDFLESCAIQISPDQPSFVKSPYIEEIVGRAMNYIKIGAPVHFQGPSGTGKTTLAMYIAGKLGKPTILIHGDEEFGTSDLVGKSNGYRSKRVYDNFIQSVKKFDEKFESSWVDNRLTLACKHGCTLIYDEFTRSRPEANNVLLSVLEEKILDIPTAAGSEDANLLHVHPDFTVIFTSNPEEYAGVHKSQDALRDRMITINLDHYDRDSEITITEKKAQVPRKQASIIVDLVRDFRKTEQYKFSPTVRACIMIAKILKLGGAKPNSKDDLFMRTCFDILDPETYRVVGTGKEEMNRNKARTIITKLVAKHCDNGGKTK